MTKVVGLFRNAEETRQAPAGTVIFREGDAGDHMYGVVDGRVELQVGGQVIGAAEPDDIFGEMALIDGSPRMATAVATQDTNLAVIGQRRFLFLVHETPMFALQVMSTLADRLRRETVALTNRASADPPS